MIRLTDAEILDRHRQALGEASRACQELGRFADPLLIGLKGGHYMALKSALDVLEGSARQIGQLRADARWVRLGAVYGRTRITIAPMYGRQAWVEFGKLRSLFDLGERRLGELDMKTGKLGAILPQRASEWLIMPPVTPFSRPFGSTVH